MGKTNDAVCFDCSRREGEVPFGFSPFVDGWVRRCWECEWQRETDGNRCPHCKGTVKKGVM